MWLSDIRDSVQGQVDPCRSAGEITRTRTPIRKHGMSHLSHTRHWYLYGLAILAVTLVVLAIAQIGPPTSSARTATQIVTADTGIVQSTATGSGNVEAGIDDDVNFQTSGILSHVYVKVGQHVNKGQLLATLSPRSAQLALDEAEQNLTAAQDQLSSAESSSSLSTTDTAFTSADSA